jgi:hypothetical protein
LLSLRDCITGEESDGALPQGSRKPGDGRQQTPAALTIATIFQVPFHRHTTGKLDEREIVIGTVPTTSQDIAV